MAKGSASPTGLMNIGMWEDSPADIRGDTAIKKRMGKQGLSKEAYESSAEDIKHDIQKSSKGIAMKKGGAVYMPSESKGKSRKHTRGCKIC